MKSKNNVVRATSGVSTFRSDLTGLNAPSREQAASSCPTEEIGVRLAEGFMMDPEANISAMVFHHLDCAYFGVGDTGC